MKPELFYNTVNARLKSVLLDLMKMQEFEKFRLVGGTALSLQFGHRLSVDIDLFSDADYGTLNFDGLSKKIESSYGTIQDNQLKIIGMGKSIFINPESKDAVKLDIYYTDQFVFPMIEIDGIRMAAPEEIIAMKLDIFLRGGRRKDFWDIHEMFDYFTLKQMISYHEKRYYSDYSFNYWKSCLRNFEIAEEDLNPQCLRGKYWDLIKLDMMDL